MDNCYRKLSSALTQGQPDFNLVALGFWRRNDEPDSQGITEIRHIERLYAMWDDLRARHPGLVIDNQERFH